MKKSKHIISRILSSLIASTVSATCFPYEIHSHAEEAPQLSLYTLVTEESSEYGLSEFYYVDENGNRVPEPNLIPTGIDRSTSYPSSYDLRDYDRVTSIKNQSLTETCWAHAVLNAAESNMITQGYADTSIDYSEAHLVWFGRGAAEPDTLSPIYGDGESLGVQCYDEGGNHLRAQAALSRGNGVQLQANAPDVTETPELDESQRYVSYARLANSDVIDPSDRDSVKAAVMNTGAVTVSYYSVAEYYTYNSNNSAYYQTEYDSTNHAVSIIGWDDNFSKENFVNGGTPASDGAWLCKNSWSENWGDDGCFYLSYYDTSVANAVSYEMKPASYYDTIYQYDGYAPYYLGYGDDYGITGANIFTSEGNGSVSSVGFSTYNTNVNYTIYVYTGVQDGNPMSGTRRIVQSGTADYVGFHTVELNEKISIQEGEDFSVVVAFPDGGSKFFIDDTTNENYNSRSYLTWGSGTNASSWTSVQESYGKDVAIKAYVNEGVAVDEVNFPDVAFRSYVSANCDTDSNGLLSDTEISKVTEISVDNLGIYELTGIEYFTALTSLSCSGNYLLYLDLSQNTKLTSLSCSDNVRSFSALACGTRTIDGLDVSKVSGLSGASIKNNALFQTALSVSYTYDCGNSFTAVFKLTASALNHQYGSWTNSSSTQHSKTCSVCGDIQYGSHSIGSWIDNGTNHIQGCSLCSYSQTANHSYGDWTDNGDGTHSRSCDDCGAEESDTHSYGDWTDNGDGTHSSYCDDCGAEESDTHSYGDWTDNGDGTHSSYCDDCGAEESDTHSYGDWTDNGDGTHSSYCDDCGSEESDTHSYGDWTDNGDGTHSRSCDDCGAEESDTHSYGDWTDNGDGTHSSYCDDCGAEESDTHSYGDWTDNGDGTHSRSCADCGAEESDTHSYGDWTDNGDGTHSRSCADCGAEESDTHSYGDWTDNGDGTYSSYCDDCGAEESDTHAYGDWTDNGDGTHSSYCDDCGAEESDTHAYGDWTDNGDGTHSSYCDDCGAEESDTHAYGDWTDNGDGTHSSYCNDCGSEESNTHAYGDWTDNGDGTHSSYCDDCGAEESDTHSYGDWTDNGDGTHSSYCDDCGSEESDTHSYGDWTDNGDGTHSRSCADCEAEESDTHSYGDWTDNGDGTHSRSCDDCGAEESDTHSYGDWTDNGDGTHSSYCDDCGAEESDTHSYGDWTNTGNASQSRICSGCGHTETQDIVYILGDINDDGFVDIFDLILMKKVLIAEYTGDFNFYASDVNEDGVFSIVDIVILHNYMLGKISKLGS